MASLYKKPVVKTNPETDKKSRRNPRSGGGNIATPTGRSNGFHWRVTKMSPSTGPDRAMLYTLAASTGFRKGELGSLTVRGFRLDKEPCTVTVQAAYSKHRREDVQIMHPELVTKFKEWIAHKNVKPNEILFPVARQTCSTDRDGGTFMTFDLNAARTFWIAEAETETEEKSRLASDFLTYKNFDGKFADFHSLRHTFVTNLGKAKVSPKTAQTLARHSDISLTMKIYTHIDQEDQIEAINSLPRLGQERK